MVHNYKSDIISKGDCTPLQPEGVLGYTMMNRMLKHTPVKSSPKCNYKFYNEIK